MINNSKRLMPHQYAKCNCQVCTSPYLSIVLSCHKFTTYTALTNKGILEVKCQGRKSLKPENSPNTKNPGKLAKHSSK